MFCSKCGGRVDVGATICSNCQAKIELMKFCQKCGEAMP